MVFDVINGQSPYREEVPVLLPALTNETDWEGQLRETEILNWEEIQRPTVIYQG